MRVLVACEFSGVVSKAFRYHGHDAWSCDLLASEGTREYHLRGDVMEFLDGKWDLMIAHPPCRFLSNSGVKHLYHGGKKCNAKNSQRWIDMQKGALFFKKLMNLPIPRICIENPIIHGYAEKIIGKEHDQLIQPWHFGHKEMKATCFWLKGLPELKPTNIVGPPPKDPDERKKWAKVHRASPGPDRWKERSRTLQGIADAMAEQWGTA